MMRRLILAAALIPTLAHAQAPAQPTPAQPQAAPAQFCISPSLAQTLAATLHQDAVLLALDPNSLAGELDSGALLPDIPASLPVGLPSDLLRRRPDVTSWRELLETARNKYERTGDELGLTPRARILATALSGADPTIMLTGPAPASQTQRGMGRQCPRAA